MNSLLVIAAIGTEFHWDPDISWNSRYCVLLNRAK